MTATEITKYEQAKEMYRKMGVDIEFEWCQQMWTESEHIRKALAMQAALKTKTVIEVQKPRFARALGNDWGVNNNEMSIM